MPGLTRVEAQMHGVGAGLTTPSIIGDPVINVNSTDPHSQGTVAITPTSDTELIVVAVLITGAAGQNNHLSGVTSSQDGALALAKAGADDPFAATNKPGWGFAWIKPTTKEVSHTITYDVTDTSEAAASMSSSAAVAFNIKDIDTADPIGAVRSIVLLSDVQTLEDTINVETAGALLLSFAGAQGADTDPFTANLGATLLATGDTGGGSTTLDAGYGVAKEIIGATGNTNYSHSWSSADGCSAAAIEIRVKP